MNQDGQLLNCIHAAQTSMTSEYGESLDLVLFKLEKIRNTMFYRQSKY